MLRGRASHHRVGLHGLQDQGACSHLGPVSDGDVPQDGSARPDQNVVRNFGMPVPHHLPCPPQRHILQTTRTAERMLAASITRCTYK